jgi:uncharacterized membrane protein YoaK (UPF0700 family)
MEVICLLLKNNISNIILIGLTIGMKGDIINKNAYMLLIVLVVGVVNVLLLKDKLKLIKIPKIKYYKYIEVLLLAMGCYGISKLHYQFDNKLFYLTMLSFLCCILINYIIEKSVLRNT